MPALKQSETLNSDKKQYRAVASEMAVEGMRSKDVKAVGSVPNIAIQRKPVIQKKPGEDDELPVQRMIIGSPGTTLQAFRPVQSDSTHSGHGMRPFIQTKLTVNAPGDQYEQEADAMADKVMRMPANSLPFSPPSGTTSSIQRRCKDCEDDEKVHRKETSAQPVEAGNDVSSYVSSLSSKGSPMPGGAKSFFEPRFGRDFSNVKVHTDGVAAKSAQSINALAYTTGNNIVFNQNQFAPDTDSGKKLLAHELTHVVQQNTGSGKGIQKFDSFEHVEIGEAVQSTSGYILLNSHLRDLPNRLDPVSKWPKTMLDLYNKGDVNQKRFLQQGLTYGEILALSGDFYKKFDDLNNAPLREIFDLIPLIRTPGDKTGKLQEATGGRYMALALKNQAHFSVGSGNNMDTWKQMHIQAIAAAKSGNANLAYATNAAADHFLTDRFAAGHLLTQRNTTNTKGMGFGRHFMSDEEEQGMSALIDHNIDNQNGVNTHNARGDKWIAYGDDMYDSPLNAQSKAYTLEATQSSVDDIKEALTKGKDYTTPGMFTFFKAEYIVPVLDGSTSIVKHTEAVREKEYDNITGPASSIPGKIYDHSTQADNLIRDWLGRIDDAGVKAVPLEEKIRMTKELFSGWVSGDDKDAFAKLYKNSSPGERKIIGNIALSQDPIDAVMVIGYP